MAGSHPLKAFGNAFAANRLHEITPGSIDDFLITRSEGWDRASFHKRLSQWFAYAKRQRWILENPFDELDRPRTPGGRKDVYTPLQFIELLADAAYEDEEVCLFLALSGLAFMRSQELVRRTGNEPVLEWRDILWERKLIHVREEVAKSTRRKSGNERSTPICDALASWLKGKIRPGGRVITCSIRAFRKRLQGVFKRAGVPFIDNGLRHSAISYWLAAHPEFGVAQISQWAGNSESSCRNHYVKLLTEEQGREWFNVSNLG